MVMATTKLYPFINRHTGDVQTLTKNEGAKLNEDWHRGKVARNEKGEKVFRFQIATQAPDQNGVMRNATAIVDIQEIKTEVIEDGNERAE
jgi:hypothetical protein